MEEDNNITRNVQEEYSKYVKESASSLPGSSSSKYNLVQSWGYDDYFFQSNHVFLNDNNDTDIRELFNSVCGGGCPLKFPMGIPQKDEIVMDVGCGSGLDVIIASHMVGANGKVIGFDVTHEMVQLAKKNIKKFNNSSNIHIFNCNMEHTEDVKKVLRSLIKEEEEEKEDPMSENNDNNNNKLDTLLLADVVISNGVVNLCPNKQKVFDTISQILKQGGRFLFNDVCRMKTNEPPSQQSSQPHGPEDQQVGTCTIGDQWSN